jgi:RNA polymerase sigma factor (sigma-70 family)
MERFMTDLLLFESGFGFSAFRGDMPRIDRSPNQSRPAPPLIHARANFPRSRPPFLAVRSQAPQGTPIARSLVDPASTQDLLERARAGDERAWAGFVDAFAPLVFAIARRHGLPPDACDDIAQDVFRSLVRSLSSIRDAQALPAWLGTTTRRLCWKARKTRPVATEALEPAAPDERDLAQLERHALLREALSRLGERCEQLLRFLYLVSPAPSYEQIAASLDMAIGSIGPTRQRCLARLASLLPHALRED